MSKTASIWKVLCEIPLVWKFGCTLALVQHSYAISWNIMFILIYLVDLEIWDSWTNWMLLLLLMLLIFRKFCTAKKKNLIFSSIVMEFSFIEMMINFSAVVVAGFVLFGRFFSYLFSIILSMTFATHRHRNISEIAINR